MINKEPTNRSRPILIWRWAWHTHLRLPIYLFTSEWKSDTSSEYHLFYRALLQTRPIIWRRLLIVGTPGYIYLFTREWEWDTSSWVRMRCACTSVYPPLYAWECDTHLCVRVRYRVTKTHWMFPVARHFSAKEPRIIGLFCGKWPIQTHRHRCVQGGVKS